MKQDSGDAPIRKRALYAGRVQGVGFPVTVHELSADFRVSGFVRNMPDGSVELEAEGPLPEVEGFLAAIAARMRRNIQSQQVDELPVTGDPTDFIIKY